MSAHLDAEEENLSEEEEEEEAEEDYDDADHDESRSGRDVECPMCGRVFPDVAALVAHCGGIRPELDDEPYYCACGESFCSPQNLASHCEATGHAPEELPPMDAPVGHRALTCPRCGRRFGSEAALKAHCGGELPDPHDDEPHWCECGRAFCSARALVSHFEATGHAQEVDVERERGLYLAAEDLDDMSYDDLRALDDDNYRRGLSDAALAALPRRRLLPTDGEDPITKEKLKGPEVVALSCGHVFDETMLLKWFQSHRTCPVCRSELEE